MVNQIRSDFPPPAVGNLCKGHEISMVNKWITQLERRIIKISGRSCRGAGFFSLETLLIGLSLIYGVVTLLRGKLYRWEVCKRHRLPCRVISFGNIAAGGSGKTPMVMHAAALLCSMGLRPVVISRGYGGSAGKKGAVAGDGHQVFLGPTAAGDEPCMMASRRAFPVIVDRNRVRAGHLAVNRFHPHVILLDDGFQHLKLHRDLDVVLMDAASPVGNGRHLPAGRLRESPAAVADRAHVVIYTRSTGTTPPPGNWTRDKPVFMTRHVPFLFQYISCHRPFNPSIAGATSLSRLAGKKALVFSAVADNAGFRHSVASLGVTVLSHTSFRDHHWFTPDEITTLRTRAVEIKADFVVTTEKDFIRLDPTTPWPVDLAVLGVDIEFFEGDENFRQLLWPGASPGA